MNIDLTQYISYLENKFWKKVNIINENTEEIAKNNNGFLPKGLSNKGFNSLESFIRRHLDQFHHLKIKD